MRLPEELRRAIDRQMEQTPAPALARTRAAAEISEAYRKGEFAGAPLKSTAHRLAYLQVRMPATHAACRHVFSKLKEALPDFEPRTCLDLGSGPGTAGWAVVETFPFLEKISFVERDLELLKIGKALAVEANAPVLRVANWTAADLRSVSIEPQDLIILSYALGELNPNDAQRLVAAASKAAQVLVLIDPGTPKAFTRMAELRKQLIVQGLMIAAPCPHEHACPLLARGDWCHFAERLERTAEHRRMKGGALGYEDEKFSYLCAMRLPIGERAGRIVRHPQIHSGYVQLQVCAPDALKQITVTKSKKEPYRAARKAGWGDRWPAS
jgi:ribosomal protein RSM22 (predicted rRNA methylase)